MSTRGYIDNDIVVYDIDGGILNHKFGCKIVIVNFIDELKVET